MEKTQVDITQINISKVKGISIKRSILILVQVIILLNIFTLPFYLVGSYFGESSIVPYIETMGEIIAYVVVIYILIKKPRLKEGFRFKLDNKPTIVGLIFSVVLVIGYILIAGNTIHLLLSQIEVSQWVTEAFTEIFKYPLLAIIGTCVIAPIFEEIIFRGIILERLCHRYNKVIALIVSSLLFGMFHLNIHQGINAFFLALIMGGVYLSTQSLYMSIFVHFVNNALVTLATFSTSSDMSSTLEQSSSIQFSLGQLVVGIILFVVGVKVFKILKVNNEINKFITDGKHKSI